MTSEDGVSASPPIVLDKTGSWSLSPLPLKRGRSPRWGLPPAINFSHTLIVHDQEFLVPLLVAALAPEELSPLLRYRLDTRLQLRFLKDSRHLFVVCID